MSPLYYLFSSWSWKILNKNGWLKKGQTKIRLLNKIYTDAKHF